MSSWNIGIHDVSEEAQAYKDRLSSKDSEIAAQQNQLMKQAADLDELRATLNETLHKLSQETERALGLERNFSQCSEELKNQKIGYQNITIAQISAQEQVKAKDLEIRGLHAFIDRISHESTVSDTKNKKLEREKDTLAARVRELEVNLRELSSPAVTPGRLRTPRPRSSSLSNFRITSLEQELNDTRSLLSEKEAALHAANQKLASVQSQLIKVDNEKIGIERRLSAELAASRTLLEAKDEELRHLRDQQGDSGREEELILRIEEDEAKISALEMLLRDADDVQEVSEKLKKTERLLQTHVQQLADAESLNIELVREKETALDELEEAHTRVEQLNVVLEDSESRIRFLTDEQRDLRAQIASRSTHSTAPQQGNPSPELVSESDSAEVADVARLLAAIERLRAERDNLRRDFQFLETESKFTIQALEAKVADTSTIEKQTKLAAELRKDGIRKAERIRRLELATGASAIVLRYLQSQVEMTHDAMSSMSTSFSHAEARIKQLEEEVNSRDAANADMSTQLQVTVQCLQATTAERDDLLSQISHLETKRTELEGKIDEAQHSYKDTQDHLQQSESHFTEVVRSLEEAESERDSLRLQVTNLLTDLDHAQQELVDAESRYSSLQLHQLSAMSSNEATHALRDQIRELEGRVLRRTEQIGVLQHDVKRLETNLRLQEERISEMTMDLETISEQKQAMVEDCADARDVRDEALSRVDRLEVQCETLEGQIQEREDEIVSLVGVVMQAAARSRMAAVHYNQVATRQEELEEKHIRATERLQNLASTNEDMARQLEEKAVLLDSLRERIQDSSDEANQIILALAVSQLTFTRVERNSQGITSSLEAQLREIQLQLETKFEETRHLQEHLETLRTQASPSGDLSIHTAELEMRLKALEQELADAHVARQDAVDKLQQSGAQVRQLEGDLVSASNAHKNEVDQLQQHHTAEVGKIQERLDQVSAALEAARSKHSAAEEICLQQAQTGLADLRAKHRDAIDEVIRAEASTREQLEADHEAVCNDLRAMVDELKAGHVEKVTVLQKSLDEASLVLEQSRSRHAISEADYKKLLDEHLQAVKALEQRLAGADCHISKSESLTTTVAQLQEEVDRLQNQARQAVSEADANAEVRKELESLHQEAVAVLRKTCEDYEVRLTNTVNDSRAVKQQLEDQIAEMDAKQAKIRRELQVRSVEVSRLQDELRNENTLRLQERETHAREVESLAEQHRNAESTQAQLCIDIATTKAELEQTRNTLNMLQEEKYSWQIESTNLEAEIQRSIALTRHLESQISDSQRTIVSLKEALDKARADLAHSEQSGQAALVNLSLREAQHKRAMSVLNRELAALQARPDLASTVADLAERNNEMEELLRSKCAEIEENDDRVLEILKEKKKLATKVETLTRKVQNLQTKLASAKSTAPSPSSEVPSTALPSSSTPLSRPHVEMESYTPPDPLLPSQVSSSSSNRAPMSRIVSGSSSLARPKTPERKAPPPVFKARTPERRAAVPSTPNFAPPLPSAGKKRRTPDDFEDCEGVPPQAFTADSVPDEQTPRFRKVLHSVHSGFTPVRHHVRPTAAIPSPKRAVTGAHISPFISDVTNMGTHRAVSHMTASQVAKTSKRSWLGKIRGSSQVPMSSTVGDS